jgi:hypothetical protein
MAARSRCCRCSLDKPWSPPDGDGSDQSGCSLHTNKKGEPNGQIRDVAVIVGSLGLPNTKRRLLLVQRGPILRILSRTVLAHTN